MKRRILLIAALVPALALAVAFARAGPASGADGAADGAVPHSGRVLIVADGDITVPAGEQADALLVFDGTATIRGEANAVAVFGGQAVLEGARVEGLLVVDGTARIDAASRVLGDVRTIDATVDVAPGSVAGSVRGLESDLAAAAVFLAPALGLVYLGLTVALVVVGLVVAALAGRQVRATARLIQTDLGPTLGAGLLGLVLPPFVAVLLAVTLIGIPTGLGLLVVVWPAIAFAGYLVAGVWLGELLLGRRAAVESERPYLAAVVGLVVLQVVAIIPLVGAVLGFLGFGAVLLAAWRVFRQGRIERPGLSVAAGAPVPA